MQTLDEVGYCIQLFFAQAVGNIGHDGVFCVGRIGKLSFARQRKLCAGRPDEDRLGFQYRRQGYLRR